MAGKVDEFTDGELVRVILEGRTDLYEVLVRRYQRDVLRIVGTLLCDRHTVDDLAQQVFVNAYFSLPRYQQEQDFGAWVRTIARNAIREELRRRSRYNRRLKTYYGTLSARLANENDASLYEELLEESLRKCLRRLAPRAGRVVRLRYDEAKSVEKIAKDLGTSPNAISTLLYRARLALRECVEREMAER
jgi:RNA polymerase sigma-70 factor (ECF subfamily)